MCAEHAVVGDSDMAVAGLQLLADKTRAGHILAWMNIGSTPHKFVLESMEQLAREVMPRIKADRPARPDA